MDILHKHLTIESDTITLSELNRFRGRNVELFVFDETPQINKSNGKKIDTFLALAGNIDIDEEAMYQLRTESIL